MDQISVLIESMCSIRDDDLRLIERKQVESQTGDNTGQSHKLMRLPVSDES